MESEIRARFKWIKLYEESNNAGLVCRRCGIGFLSFYRRWYFFDRGDCEPAFDCAEIEA